VQPSLGFFARNSHAKGLHTLVDAFNLLKQQGKIANLKLRVAGTRSTGDDAFVEELQRKVEQNGFTSDAEFLPPLSRSEKIAFLQSLSVMSVPATYGEAFGLYVIEALACGVPVVQPRSGAFPELIEATGGGILCEPDDPQSLAEQLELLLTDRDHARALGEAGRKAVLRDFSSQKMAENFLQVLQSN
jgi:glycosyltransferase involved in cell wall biosynthesis